MISFRYHVVSLVAVLVALAAGIAVGSGPLQRSDDDATGDTDVQALVEAEARVERLEASLGFADAYTAATADSVLGNGLADRAVTLVRLPGAEEAAVENITDMVGRAGGSVTAGVVVGEQLLDVGNRQLVEELGTQMSDSVGRDVQLPADASGYELMGALVARAVTTDQAAGAPVDEAGDSILAGLETAELVTTTGEIERRGSLVVVVSGAPYGDADTRSGAGTILGTLLGSLEAASNGVVLAGPVGSAAEDGLVGAVRDQPTLAQEVSTVDVAERVAGAVTTVLALQQEAQGRSGHYGTAAAGDGAVPGAGEGTEG